jgi:kynurenine formamidase
MKSLIAAIGIVGGLSILTAHASAQTCPWKQADPSDKVGASHTQTSEKALEGARLVRSGKVFGLSHVYDEAKIPRPFDRVFEASVSFFDMDEAGPSQVFSEGTLNGQLGQVGTQFDALGHGGHDLGFYNCASSAEVGPDDAGLLLTMDVASVAPFFTRAVFLDFVHHSDVPKTTFDGEEIVQDSYVISGEDIEHVLQSENVAPPGPGDVVIFYTGWDKLFGVDNDRLFFAPGPGIEATRWLASKNVAMVGADTMSVEALDGGESVEIGANPTVLGAELGAIPFPVHFILLTQSGIHLLENMKLTPLAEDLVASDAADATPYEFLFTFAPVPIKGLESSPGQPLAVR